MMRTLPSTGGVAVGTGGPRPDAHRRRRARHLRWALGWAAFLALAALFVVFRPANLGGTTTYTFLVGVSMEPTYHTGDLAIVVPWADYAIGDVVCYHPSAAPTGTIIHRIVGGDPVAGFVTKGDGRTDPDPDRTPAAQLIGKAILVIPQAARVLNAVREPLVLAALAAILAAWITWDWMDRRDARARR